MGDEVKKLLEQMPRLTDEEIGKFDHRKTVWTNNGGYFVGNCDMKGLAQAQRKADAKWFGEKLYDQTMQAKKSGWDDCEKWHKEQGLVQLPSEEEVREQFPRFTDAWMVIGWLRERG